MMPLMRRATLAAFLLAASVAVAAQSAATLSVQSPEEFFGFRMGADRRLAGWPEIRKYFETIAAESDRVELVDAGPTTDGNRMIAAMVSAPENIARLEEIRSSNLRLADPRQSSDEEARRIATHNPVVVAIGASIHASEIGATQAANELLHHLATSTSSEVESVLRDVVLVLIPSLNPDGHILTVDWYRKWLGTPFEGTSMPWLYHRYVGHDINRDAFMMNMAENRTIADFFYRRWHPQVFLAMHQMGPRGPRFFVPPNYDPIDPNYDPLIWRTAGLLGHAMALSLEEDGRRGVVSNALYDYYWPGYEDSAPLGHNTVCVLTEVASVRVATPITVEASELVGSPRGLPEYRAQINFPNPWPGGDWRLRDIVDYDLSAVRGLLTAAARYREELLLNFHRMGRNAVEAGRRGGPFAFIIPPEQFDPHAANKLRQLLLDGAVEIHRAIEPFRVADVVYPAGTDLVLMAQPFRAYAKTLLERQAYPARRRAANTAPERPYDVAGWTLPLQTGVKVDRIEQTFEPPAVERLGRSTISAARVWGDASARGYIIDGRGTGASIAINRLLAGGFDVAWTTTALEVNGHTFAPGSVAVSGNRAALRTAVNDIAGTLGLRADAVSDRVVANSTRKLPRVRVGLYKPWLGNIDEGWTRWLLEQYQFPFETLTDQDIRKGALRTRVDVIVIPDDSRQRILNGHMAGSMPAEYTGGIGSDGAEAIKQFVHAGGTLITLDSSSDFAINLLDLAVRDVLRGVPPDQFFCPGSLLRMTLDSAHPLSYGMPSDAAAFFAFGSGFEATSPAAKVPGRYGLEDVLLSGWLEGEKAIAGQGAIVEAAVGDGRAVLFGFRVQHRGQALGTLRLFFNAIHTASALPLPASRRRATP
jgi:hypothetical protein